MIDLSDPATKSLAMSSLPMSSAEYDGIAALDDLAVCKRLLKDWLRRLLSKQGTNPAP